MIAYIASLPDFRSVGKHRGPGSAALVRANSPRPPHLGGGGGARRPRLGRVRGVAPAMPPRDGRAGTRALSSKLLLALLLALAASALGACAAPVEPPRGKAWLSLGLGAGSARSIAPAGIELASIHLSGCGPGEECFDRSLAAGASREDLELLPGAWIIEAEGLNAGGLVLARGRLELCLEPGETRRADLLLAAAAGAGSLRLAWSLAGDPGSGATVTARLEREGMEPRLLEAPASDLGFPPFDLDSGSYVLNLALKRQEERLCGLVESVAVVAGMETVANLALAPPAARMGISFILPELAPRRLGIVPPRRRIAAGTAPRFLPSTWPAEGERASWFLEGSPSGAGAEAVFEACGPGRYRVDLLLESPTRPAASAQAEILVGESFEAGPLVWAESLLKADYPAGAEGPSALSGARDLCLSSTGELLATASPETKAVSFFAWEGPGSLRFLGTRQQADDPELASPGRILALADGSFLIYSEAVGAFARYGPLRDELGRPLEAGGCLRAELAGASDLALSPDGSSLYAAIGAGDAVFVAELGPDGLPGTGIRLAGRGDPGLEAFSKPLCLALSPEGAELLVGTGGDDAIYRLSLGGPGVNLVQRLDKSLFASLGSLSDPVALAWLPGGEGFLALSYYGKSLFRCDRPAPGSDYAPTAVLKSGSGPASGFDYPRRLVLEPATRRAFIASSGAGDGLAAVSAPAAGGLNFLGLARGGPGDSTPARPLAAALDAARSSIIYLSGEAAALAAYVISP